MYQVNQLIITQKIKDMKKVTKSTIIDVKLAWEMPARSNDRITHNWIYSVDPETMEEVKELWKTMPGTASLYKAFVYVLGL